MFPVAPISPSTNKSKVSSIVRVPNAPLPSTCKLPRVSATVSFNCKSPTISFFAPNLTSWLGPANVWNPTPFSLIFGKYFTATIGAAV